MTRDWLLDDRRQTGIDFADPNEVDAYDERQNNDPVEDNAVLDRLGARSGQTLIDIGAGTGSFAVTAAERGLRVFAVDVSPGMLGAIDRRAARANVFIETHHGGFLTYHHTGQAADFVTSSFALHHLPDFWKGVALLRVAEMLIPGGIFFLRDVVFSFPVAEYEQGIESWMGSVAREEGGGWSRADFATHVREEDSTFGWIMTGLIERAGFELLEATYPDPAYADYLCRRPVK